MDRFLNAKTVMTEILNEHEEVVTAQMISEDPKEMMALRSEAEALRRVIERIAGKLPERQHIKWKAKLRKHYAAMATGISFDMEGK